MYPAYPTAAQQLEAADHEDAGRGLEFVYFDVEGGAQLAALTALNESGTLIPPSGGKNSALGPYFGVTTGIRLLFLTVGPRFRFAHFADWDLWTLNLDVGWHIPLGNLEPYALLGGGFAKLGRSAEGEKGIGDVSVSGFNVRLGGGIDYYLSNVLAVGATAQLDLLRLSRGATTIGAPGDVNGARWSAYGQDASSLGLVVTAGAVVGLHF